MSDRAKVKIGKFGQKLGFPGIGKKPQRKELLSLMSQASTYQPNEKATVLFRTLSQALQALEATGDVEKQISEANKVAATARDTIAELKEEKEQAEKLRKSQQPSKKQLKSMKQAREDLTEELNSALAEIEPDLGKIRLDPEHAKTALLALGETIRREIGAGDPNETSGTGTRADDFREEIEELKTRIDQANVAHRNEQSFMTTRAVKETDRAVELLKNFDEAAKGEYQGPLRRTVEVLQMNMTAVPADPTLIRVLLSQVSKARQSARKDKNFVAESHKQGVEQNNAEEMTRRLESMLGPIKDDLEFLRISEAPGYGKMSDTLNKLRLQAGKPVGSREITKATLEMRQVVDGLASEAEKQRELLEATISNDGEAAQKALVEAKQQFAIQQKLHGDAQALEADFKTIEALIGGAEQILPATGDIPKNISSKDVKLARSLAEQAAAKLKDIADNKDALTSFDTDAKDLAKQLDERTFFSRLKGNSRGVLEKYDPKSREDLDKRLSDLLKALPTTPAKTSMEAFKTLKEDAEKAVTDLQPIADYIEKTAEPLYANMKLVRMGWAMGDGVNPPRKFDDALDALEAQVKLQPPVLTALQSAVSTADQALKEAESLSDDERSQVSRTELAEDEKKRRENEKRRSAESKLLKKLEDKYDVTKNAVDEVKGDTNALAAAQRLIDQIKSDIKSDAFDKLESKRKDLEARLNLLLSNPRGETNRRKSELPGVIEELRGTLRAAAESLEKVAGEIEQHAAKDDNELEAQEDAAKLLRLYAELLESEIDDMASAAKPITNPKTQDEDARRKAREEGLRILRSFRGRVRAQPMTTELLTAPFPDAKGAIAPVFRVLDKYEYTLTTCI